MNAREKREQMVYQLKHKYGINSSDVLSVMLQVPRHKFVSKKLQDMAYEDNPVSIGYGQTMSQPYTVAFMTDLLDLTGKEKVLEIGTGSGYQAAVLSKLAKEVYTIEIVDELAKSARRSLKKLNYKNVFVKAGSGEYGWIQHAPYDAILVTAGIKGDVPKELFDQLRSDGVLVAPVKKGSDEVMTKFIKDERGKIESEEHGIFRFVPFIKKDN